MFESSNVSKLINEFDMGLVETQEIWLLVLNLRTTKEEKLRLMEEYGEREKTNSII